MLKQKYTTVTQLHEVNNKDIIEYFENISVYFCKLQREAFHIFKNENRFKYFFFSLLIFILLYIVKNKKSSPKSIKLNFFIKFK